eukprot:6836735-Lingulodinium_polyedra.AAC.1
MPHAPSLRASSGWGFLQEVPGAGFARVPPPGAGWFVVLLPLSPVVPQRGVQRRGLSQQGSRLCSVGARVH